MRSLLVFLVLALCATNIMGQDVPRPDLPTVSAPTLPPPIIRVPGCSLGYWKNHLSVWNPVIPTTTPIISIFSNVNWTNVNFIRTTLSPTTTLEQALNANGGGLNNVYRQGVAAYLNALIYGARTGYSIPTVQATFQQQAESTKPAGESLENLALWCHGGRTTTTVPGATDIPTGGYVYTRELSSDKGQGKGNGKNNTGNGNVGDGNGNGGNNGKNNTGNGNVGGNGKKNNTGNAGGPVVLTAVYSITFLPTAAAKGKGAGKGNTGGSAQQDIVKSMISFAERAGLDKKNFLINRNDVIQNTTETNRWSVKVGFKSNDPIQRAMDLNTFTSFLYAQVGLNAIRTAGAAANADFQTDESQDIPYTFEPMATQTCQDGSDIDANQVCQDTQSQANAGGDSDGAITRTLIIPIAAGVGGLLLVIATVIIMRRRRTNTIKIKTMHNIAHDQVAQHV